MFVSTLLVGARRKIQESSVPDAVMHKENETQYILAQAHSHQLAREPIILPM
jgi:hypothetical protein